jgi:hypothetical protein
MGLGCENRKRQTNTRLRELLLVAEGETPGLVTLVDCVGFIAALYMTCGFAEVCWPDRESRERRRSCRPVFPRRRTMPGLCKAVRQKRFRA